MDGPAARKARLAGLAGDQRHIVQAPLFLVWLIDLNRLTKLAEERGEHAGALDYLESFLLGAVDATLAAHNAVVALESLGLGAVYIGGIRNKPAEEAAELNLPPQVFALFGVVVGKPDPATPASVKPRRPQQAVLFHKQDEWGAVQHEAVAAYNPRIREFQREQGMPEQDWTAQCVTPSRSTAAMCCVTWCTSSVLS